MYFKNQDIPLNHHKIEGASVLPKNDPTLLFINSGMAPLKSLFTGEVKPQYPRLCNIQTCIRTNDIDDIGDMHHLSLFHMLGSWSIGDYYKKDAIKLAYKLLVDVLKFPKEKLYVTVFGGDVDMKIDEDSESVQHWLDVGVSEDHIVRLPADDNFWGPAGETGPCGPCTEIFYDMGEGYSKPYIPGDSKTFDTKKRYVEIWNGGVFMQFFKHSDGSFTKLNFTSVDTGSGLERMTMTMNRYESVYDCDLIKPMYDATNKELELLDIATKRMITDHLRTATYLISEGVVPGNNGKEYIVRKLIRKCIASIAISKYRENIGNIFISIIPKIINEWKNIYPHFLGNEKKIESIINEETISYIKVLKDGIKYIEHNLPKGGAKFSVEKAHHIVTTVGVPIEFLLNYLAEKGFTLDVVAFNELKKAHHDASKKLKSTGVDQIYNEETTIFLRGMEKTTFTGYETLEQKSQIIALIKDGILMNEVSNEGQFQFIVNSTPFYAESGGQCGDKGFGKMSNGSTFEILNTTSNNNGVFIHTAQLSVGSIKINDNLSLTVDLERRAAVERAHSATHLLHFAIRSYLKEDMSLQKGSSVKPDNLRFDFELPNKTLHSDELTGEIESRVRDLISKNIKVETKIDEYQNITNSSIIRSSKENYSKTVRIVYIGPSAELCGGTHVLNTSVINYFAITKIKNISKDVKRVLALTGTEAFRYISGKLQQQPKIEKLKNLSINEIKTIDIDNSKLIIYSTNENNVKIIQKESSRIFKNNESCCGLIFASKTNKGTKLICIAKDDKLDALDVITFVSTKFNVVKGGDKNIAQCIVNANDDFLNILSSYCAQIQQKEAI